MNETGPEQVKRAISIDSLAQKRFGTRNSEEGRVGGGAKFLQKGGGTRQSGTLPDLVAHRSMGGTSWHEH